MAKWHPFAYIYKRRKAVLMHTIYIQTKPDFIEFEKFSPRSEYSRHLMPLKVNRFRTEAGRSNLKYRGAVLWNALPIEVK